MQLSVTQKRALEKLTAEWRTPYDLQESLSTLYSLTKGKLAESRGERDLGAHFFPRTTIHFRVR